MTERTVAERARWYETGDSTKGRVVAGGRALRAPPRGRWRPAGTAREWLILLGVLVPFAVLLVAGFFLTAPPPHSEGAVAPPPPSPALTPPPSSWGPDAAAALPTGPRADAARTTPTRLPATPEVPTPREDTPLGLEAALSALRPAIHQCFSDAAHRPARATLRVVFRARPDGHFDGYRLEARDWQDPRFEACVEDVFDEMTYVPDGREPAGPVTHTFVLSMD